MDEQLQKQVVEMRDNLQHALNAAEELVKRAEGKATPNPPQRLLGTIRTFGGYGVQTAVDLSKDVEKLRGLDGG